VVTPGTDSRWPPAHARHRHAGRAGSPASTLMASHLVEVPAMPGLGTGSRRAVEVVTLQGSRAARGRGGDAGHRQARWAGSPASTLMASHLVEVPAVPGLGTGSRRAVEVVTLQGSRAARGQGGDAVHRHAGRAGSPARTLRASHLVEVVTVPGLGTGSWTKPGTWPGFTTPLGQPENSQRSQPNSPA
jgi:hypothetical protein